MTDQVRPIGDSILVKQDPAQERVGLIVMPQGSEKYPNVGTVVAVGPGKVNEHGVLVPLDSSLVVGARVMFQRRASTALVPDRREGGRPEWLDLLMLREDDIIGIIEEEA